MKPKFFALLFIVLLFSACSGKRTKKINQWVINRSATSGKCIIQLTTASPIGASVDGKKYDVREEARINMCKLYEPGSGDFNKCSDVDPAENCSPVPATKQ